MLLRRIAVRNFRKLEQPIAIEDLDDGVTIIAGDNEEGKSTLLEAIRVGLFERHNLGGKALESMQPFGSIVRPEVSLQFEIDGQAYEITKGFAQKPSSILVTPSGRFEGAAAEERLAELLTFRVPTRGESKEDDRGVLGLFWLEQGRGLDRLEFGEMGRSTLRAALEDEVGDVLGGARGRKLLDRARAKRSSLLTTTGRARGELAEANAEVEALSARVAQLEEERRTYDLEVDELARVRRELAQIEIDRVIETAAEALAKAQEDDKVIKVLRQRMESAKQAVELARAQLDNANERWSRRQQLIAAVGSREDALTKAKASVEATAAAAKEAVKQLEQEKAACERAVGARAAAEERLVRSQANARIEEVTKEQAALLRTIKEVERLARDLAEAKNQLREIKISEESYDGLQKLEAARREAHAIMRAAATKVVFLPSHDQVVWKGEEHMPLADPIDVTESVEFRLDGFGRLTLEPGTADLETRREQLKEINEAYKRALAAADVSDLAEARTAFASRVELEANVREATRLIAAYAPDGFEALKSLAKALVDELEDLGDQLEGTDPPDLGNPDSEVRRLSAAKEVEDRAKRARDAAQVAAHQHETQLAISRQALEAAAENLREAREELKTARQGVSDADLLARVELSQRSYDDSETARQVATSQLNAANPDEVILRAERARSTLKSVQAERSRFREQAISLESRLDALGKGGIGEVLEVARGGMARALQRNERLQLDAQAWDLLVATLTDAERDAKEAFLKPVIKRVDPFLRLLLPDAHVTLDEETLEIRGVSRHGREEPYQSLSVGTREQLSILVRLAFAVYLREKGYPAAVILDDALVYADDDRFERMQLALRKAAETVQVLILTCRPRDWRQFGAPIRRLADSRARVAVSS